MMSSPVTARRTLLVVIVLSAVMFCSVAYGTVHMRALQARSSVDISTACYVYKDGGPVICK